jgi:hypothetical protein
VSWLRPGFQVPLATACTFAAIASIVLRALGIDRFGEEAAEVGVVVSVLLSWLAIRALARTLHPGRARWRALAFPPALGVAVALTTDLLLARLPFHSMEFAGWELERLGPAEPLAVAAFGAGVGLLGSAILTPQAWLLARTRSQSETAAFERVTKVLAVAGPPVMAALVGGGAAVLTRACDPYHPPSFLWFELADFGRGEPFVAAAIGAGIGLATSALLAPYAWRKSGADPFDCASRRLATAGWAMALAASVMACMCAGAPRASVAIFVISAIGLLAQVFRRPAAQYAFELDASPYRRV